MSELSRQIALFATDSLESACGNWNVKHSNCDALFNDYADTLRHLGRLGEAERQARRALEAGGETTWLCQVTLAEILRDAHRNPEEMRALVDAALAHAPAHLQAEIRRSFGR